MSVQSPSLPPPLPMAVPPRRRSKLLTFGIIAALAFGIYQYAGAIFNYQHLEQECLKFAGESDIKIAFNPDPNDSKLFINRKWITMNGYAVAEVAQKIKDKKDFFQSRICVIGSGKIFIPSKLQEWQYQ